MRTSLTVNALALTKHHGRVRRNAVFHSGKGAQPGFNWSSQHHRFGSRLAVRSWLGRVFSSRVSFVVNAARGTPARTRRRHRRHGHRPRRRSPRAVVAGAAEFPRPDRDSSPLEDCARAANGSVGKLYRAEAGDPGPIELSGQFGQVAEVYHRISSGRLVLLGDSGAG